MRTLLKLLRGRRSANGAILSAFLLCALYFVTWYLISHLSNFPGSLIL
ncbi:hypothetical protein LPN04_25675 [Rugamonas sp. A1-17]|nr:hypothetical protein [Rugamonas sp. A1-17]